MKSAVLLSVLAVASADVFLHNPHGSNNRFSEANANVGNARDRLFWSKNGAYFRGADNQERGIDQGGYNAPALGQSMYYYAGSILPIEWLMSNGCGSESKDGEEKGGGENSAHCQVILQYMCHDMVRDGTTEDRIGTDMKDQEMRTGKSYTYGLHENYEYYTRCAGQVRNDGLFTADLELTGETAMFTRQTPNGARAGYECNEERDYYPYWMPTPWRDIAVLTDRPDEECPTFIAESQNKKAKGYCEGAPAAVSQDECPSSAEWVTVSSWSQKYDSVDEDVDCIQAPWVMENQLTNQKNGWPNYYHWTVPDEPLATCALRIRYNVTIGDVFDLGSGEPIAARDLTGQHNLGGSPIQMEPTVQACENDGTGIERFQPHASLCNVTLHHRPAQMPSTTYEDRSHMFYILPRPSGIKNAIHNLNVRGHRGNIVQTFPAVEYDFVPTVLECRVGEWFHPQWTGSNTNPQNYAGEGLDQTDRSNMVQILGGKHNMPINWQDQTLFEEEEAVKLAYNDQKRRGSKCLTVNELEALDDDDADENAANCADLNRATPYFDGGLQSCRFPGVFHYMSTRNNNFSNRGQKGTIIVYPCNGADSCSAPDVLNVDQKGDYDAFNPKFKGANGAATLGASLSAAVGLAALLRA